MVNVTIHWYVTEPTCFLPFASWLAYLFPLKPTDFHWPIVCWDVVKLPSALYTEGDGFLNVISGTNKYTLFDGKNSGEMYVDLKSDNGELKNIISGNEAKAQTLKSFIPLEKLKPLSAKVKKEKVEKNAKRTEKQTGKVQRKGH